MKAKTREHMKNNSSIHLIGSLVSMVADVVLIIRTRNLYGYSSLAYRLWSRVITMLPACAGEGGGRMPIMARRKACEQTA